MFSFSYFCGAIICGVGAYICHEKENKEKNKITKDKNADMWYYLKISGIIGASLFTWISVKTMINDANRQAQNDMRVVFNIELPKKTYVSDFDIDNFL